MNQRVKINGTWVTRVWDEMDKEASSAGEAIKRMAGLGGKIRRKKPAKTIAVTGVTLHKERQRRLGV